MAPTTTKNVLLKHYLKRYKQKDCDVTMKRMKSLAQLRQLVVRNKFASIKLFSR